MGTTLALVCGAGAPAGSQECAVRVDDEVDESTRYFRPAELYRAGRFLEAVEAVGSMERSEVETSLDRLRRIHALSTRMIGTTLPQTACIEAAALVHTEVALLAAAEARDLVMEEHLKAATSLMGLVPNQAGRTFRRSWLLLLGYWHQDSLFTGGDIGAYPRAEQFLDEAADEYPDDAEAQLAAGALHEWAGSLRHGDRADLERARDRYRRATSAEPSSSEAFARLGHVLVKLDETEEAREPLERALELPGDHDLIYRALLSLGRLAEEAGRPEEAEGLYRRAIGLRPRWQTGYIALSHALHVSGQRRRSAEVLEEGLALERPDVDRFWTYELGLSPRLDETLEALRERVIR